MWSSSYETGSERWQQKQPITFYMDPQSYGGLGKQQCNQSHSAWILSLMEGLENNKATTTFYRDSHLLKASKTTTKQLPCSKGILVLLKLQKTTTKQLPILQGSSLLWRVWTNWLHSTGILILWKLWRPQQSNCIVRLLVLVEAMQIVSSHSKLDTWWSPRYI